MNITKVIYELYESDYLCIKDNKSNNSHEIDREVCLLLSDETKIYVSWSSEPIQYSVGYQRESWFENEPEKHLDVTKWGIWKNIIQQECEFTFHDIEHQVLELKSKDYSVFFASYEMGTKNWSTDVLHISCKIPDIIS